MWRVTRSSIINWMKMTELKKCEKVIDEVKCPCVDKLSRLYVTRPGIYTSELELKRRIEIGEKKYCKCYNKKN